MKYRIAAMALLVPLLATAVIAPRPLSVAIGRPLTTVRSAIAAYGAPVTPVLLPAAQASGDDGEIGVSDQVAPAPSFAGPGPGWG